MRILRSALALTCASVILLAGGATAAPALPAETPTPATLAQVRDFYVANMNAFLKTIGPGQAIAVNGTGTELLAYEDAGIVNRDGTMQLTRRLEGDITKAYTCPRPRKCYGKVGQFIWKKVPVAEAHREANFWTTQQSTVMLLPEDGTYTIVGNTFTYDYTARGIHMRGSFGFLPDGYGILETYSYPERSDTEYTNVTSVKRVPAVKVVYRPSLR